MSDLPPAALAQITAFLAQRRTGTIALHCVEGMIQEVEILKQRVWKRKTAP